MPALGVSVLVWLYLVVQWLLSDRGYFWPGWVLLALGILAGVHAAVVFSRREYVRSHRIETLEATRAGAVAEQETELRRIERDLHDGAQARLVALGMSIGMAEEKLTQLRVIDDWHMKLLAELLKGLKSVKEGDAKLLDRTMVLYGSNLGDANAHSTTNLPTLFAGGGFKHGRHLAFDRTRNYPLPNLFVSVLQRLGLEAASFGPSTGTMRGLEVT